MKILTIERDSGTHIINYEFGTVEGGDPRAEGFEITSAGSLDIDTDDDGHPLSNDFGKMEEMVEEADMVYEVDSIASHRNSLQIK